MKRSITAPRQLPLATVAIRGRLAGPMRFDNTYARLPERFFARQAPMPVRAPSLIKVNASLAEELGLSPEELISSAAAATFAGNQLPEGAEPLALAYAGHQFGGFVPSLGDGRAVLLGEVIDRDGVRRDIQLKGSGRTPFSRGGDGRAALGPVLREFLIAEAMFALGIPTTRALAAVATGETVRRETPLPGAILTRVARSHLRVGTFEYFAARNDVDGLQALVAYAIGRHLPAAEGSPRPALALLAEVMERQAELVARWMGVGFIHGVMNTDNTSISGETIDYGPCAFMDGYDPATVFSSIDRHGRYAYGSQPMIVGWNMLRLAEALLPVIDPDVETATALAQEQADRFPTLMEAAWRRVMCAKIGLDSSEENQGLVMALLKAMHEGGADFTNTFRALVAAAADPAADALVRAEFSQAALYDDWARDWRQRLGPAAPALRAVNPAYIPRNHRVEAAIQAATGGDFGPFDELLTVVTHPFDEMPEHRAYRNPPRPEERVLQTFCGT